MKVFFILAIIASTILPATRYEEMNFLDTKVYFPKNNSSYLEELLSEENIESLLELSLFYAKLGKHELALKYLEAYQGDNYLKKAKIYRLLGIYEQEFNILLEKKFALLSEENYYYMIDLSKKLEKELPYINFSYKLFNLLNKIHNEQEFYNDYYSGNWSEEEEKIIFETLKREDLTNKTYIKNIYYEFLSPEEKLIELYKNIKNVENNKAYDDYFSFQKELGIFIEEQNDFELLQRYRYNKEIKEFKFLYNKMLDKFIENGDFSNLMSLYLIEFNYRLAYNLAMTDENLHFKFLNFVIENKERDIIRRALLDFSNKYPNSKYKKEIKEFFVFFEEDSEKQLKLIEDYFAFYFNDKILNIYISLISKLEDEKKLIDSLEKIIFIKGIEDKTLIDLYLDFISNKKINGDKLILLRDKQYYFDYISNNSIKLPQYLEKAYIDYLILNSKYDLLKNYKDKLDLETYKLLIKKGKKEFLNYAKLKYPFDEQWLDKNNIKNFYLIKDYEYKENIAKQIEAKTRKTPAEEYYLMKYFYQEEINLEEANSIKEKLGRRYLLF